jgi:hypothetical protein
MARNDGRIANRLPLKQQASLKAVPYLGSEVWCVKYIHCLVAV